MSIGICGLRLLHEDIAKKKKKDVIFKKEKND